MEIFEERRVKKIIGVDENGYGPVLGPLIVTGVLLESDEAPFDLRIERFKFPIKIRDSKKIFTRTKSSYFAGEIVAHAILGAAGLKVRSFHELIDAITEEGVRGLLKSSSLYETIFEDFSLPVWAKEIRDNQLQKSLHHLNIKIVRLFSKIVLPYEFNQLLKKYFSKTTLDFFLFLNILEELSSYDTTGLLGKLGGTKHYTSLFEKEGVNVNEVVRETRGISSYKINLKGKDLYIHFIMDGDEVYIPITFASIVGKYIRELFMLSLNKFLGHQDLLPWASGYRHDHKTWILIEEWKKILPDIKKDYFIREK